MLRRTGVEEGGHAPVTRESRRGEIHLPREAGSLNLLARVLRAVLAFAAFFVLLLFISGQAHAQEALDGSSPGDAGSGTGGLTDVSSDGVAGLPSSSGGENIGGSTEPAGAVQEPAEPAAAAAEPPSGTVGEAAGTTEPGTTQPPLANRALEEAPQTTAESAAVPAADQAIGGTYEPAAEPTQEAVPPMDGTTGTATGATEPVVGPLGSEIEPVTNTAAPVFPTVGYTVEPTIEPVDGTAEPVVDPVAGAAPPVMGAAEPLTTPLGSTPDPAIEAVGLGVDAANSFAGAAHPVVDPVIGAVEPAAVDPMLGSASDAVKPVGGVVEPVVEPVVALVGEAVTPVMAVTEPALEPVVDATGPVVGTVGAVAVPVAKLGPVAGPIVGSVDGVAAASHAITAPIDEPPVREATPVVAEPVLPESAASGPVVAPDLGGTTTAASVEATVVALVGATSPEAAPPALAPALGEPATVSVPEGVRAYAWPTSAAEGLASPAAPVTGHHASVVASVGTEAGPGSGASIARASFADFLTPYLGNADYRLLGGSPEALVEILFAAGGVRGVLNDGAPPWSYPVSASPVVGGSSVASGLSSGVGFGMAVLCLLALLYLGGRPLLSTGVLLGPASVPRLIPELPS